MSKKLALGKTYANQSNTSWSGVIAVFSENNKLVCAVVVTLILAVNLYRLPQAI